MKEYCNHLANCEPIDRKEKLKYYFSNQRSGMKVCDMCGKILVLSIHQMILLYFLWDVSFLTLWFFYKTQTRWNILQYMVSIVFICLNWFIYCLVRAMLQWHETPYYENSIPWYMKCLYKCFVPLVFVASFLTCFLIIRSINLVNMIS